MPQYGSVVTGPFKGKWLVRQQVRHSGGNTPYVTCRKPGTNKPVSRYIVVTNMTGLAKAIEDASNGQL